MQLTHIRLAGFKSFAAPTTIHISGRLTAVIGPNGCGKSNLIDAVRWVLGENSAKQIRGQNMQDIIFNGTAGRPAQARAWVELHFDNSSQRLLGTWSRYSEISIKRQLTRQGESTYFINNQIVRRRDISELFLGTGLGARGYALIEQGMIARIIEARPEELRSYIEEAAGISKYKERRQESTNRLNETRRHLQRLNDWQHELTGQITQLEQQVKAARHYHILQQQLTDQQDRLHLSQWQQAQATADQAAAEYHTLCQEQAQTEKHIKRLDKHIHNLQQTQQQQQQQLDHLHNRHSLLHAETARLEEQLRQYHQRQQQHAYDQAAARKQLQHLKQEQQHTQEQIQQTAAQIQQAHAQYSAAARTIRIGQKRLNQLEDRQTQAVTTNRNNCEAHHHTQHSLALKQQQLTHIKHTISRHRQRTQQLKAESQTQPLPDSQAAQAHADQLSRCQAENEAALNTAETQLNILHQRVQTATTRHQTIAAQYQKLNAQYEAAQQLFQKQQHSQARFWQHTELAASPALWQHIHIADHWQTALDIILAERLHARAVPESFCPPHPLPAGSAAWLTASPVPATLPADLPDNSLLAKIQAAHPFQTALQQWLDGVLCAPDLTYALSHRHQLRPGQIWLTPEGHRVDPISTIIHAAPTEPFTVQAARLDRLKQKTKQLFAQEQQAAEQQAAAQADLTAAQATHQTLLQQQKQYCRQAGEARQQAATLHLHIQQAQQNRRQIAHEITVLAAEQNKLQHQAQQLQQDIAHLQQIAVRQQNHISDSDRRSQAICKQIKRMQQTIFEAKSRLAVAQLHIEKLQQHQVDLSQRAQQLAAQTNDWQQRQAQTAAPNQSQYQQQQAELTTLLESRNELDRQYRSTKENLAAAHSQSQTARQEQQNWHNRRTQIQAAAQAVLLKQQEATLQAQHFRQSISRHLPKHPAHPPANPDTLRRNIARLQQTINSLGAVNLAAEEELSRAYERQNYYRSKSEDIQNAIRLLEQAITQIDRQTAKQFQAGFDAVNQKLQSLFPILFEGGQASLQLNSNDLLQAGISITAQPPGKQNSSIQLLSGGEKALTAISLIFALFSLNPAPFCLLDEVDAPLDDTNTARLCRLLQEMCGQTQFIYISHKRQSMETAEQLIGVTMQEKGVSQIVSVDMQQAVQTAARQPPQTA